jgi:hypothetical protein
MTTTAAIRAASAAAHSPRPSASVNAVAALCASDAPWSAGSCAATASALPIESLTAFCTLAGAPLTASATRELYSDVISEPITAVPSEPPTWRVTSFMAEATPDFSFGTAPMTEPVAGPMMQPMDRAPRKNHRPIGQ